VGAGLLCGAAGMAVFGTARTGTLFVCGTPLMALWGLAPAAAQSIMTRRVSASEQGQLQGALGSLTGVAALVGPGLFTLIYAHSTDAHGLRNIPSAAWLLSTLMLLGATVSDAAGHRHSTTRGLLNSGARNAFMPPLLPSILK
jgi:DHA1 family tetracycline resistance protein-like MFS transporter